MSTLRVNTITNLAGTPFSGGGSAVTYNTTSFVSHGTTYGSTGLLASITPSASSKKVLVMVSIPIYMNKGANVNFQNMNLDLRRNGSSLNIIKQSGLYVGQVVSRQDYGTTVSFEFLDSPSTTSSVTYEVFAQAANTSGYYYTGVILDFSNTNNLPFSPGHIILMEVS